MAKKFINETHIEGYVYEHKLVRKESGPKSKNPGTEFISGTLSIATDGSNGENVIPVHFSYVTATTAKGKPNDTFNILSNIIDKKVYTVMEHGKENASMVRIDSAIGLNEFYTDRNGKEELVSAKRNEGGFVHMTNELTEKENQRATFKTDMVITSCVRKEADEERNIPEKVLVRGVVFDFRGAIMPVEYSAVNPGAMDYFENLGASNSNPVFTKVWGEQVSQISTRTVTEESAFGEATVKEFKNTYKDFVITGASPEPYEWDSEDTLLASELQEAIANREVHLAEVKRNQEEYKASQNNAINTAAPAPTAKGVYNF